MLRLLGSSWLALLAQLTSLVKVVLLRNVPISSSIQVDNVTGLKEETRSTTWRAV